MHKGVWYQLGDKGQKIAEELLKSSNGVGVVLSPRDISDAKAEEYGRSYRNNNAEVVFDPQLYVPQNSVGLHETHEEFMEFRVSASKLLKHSQSEFARLGAALRNVAKKYSCTAILSPAIALQAGQPEHLKLNIDLLDVAIESASKIGLPVYGVIPIGQSLALSQSELSSVISKYTSKKVDGWMLMMDLGQNGFSVDTVLLKSLGVSILRLAQTGVPVMHGCAGPHALLSSAFGASAVGIAHSKNMWHLPLSRFIPSDGGGGGASATRVFSRALWSNFVYPDEFARLPSLLKEQIVESSKWVSIDLENDAIYLASDFRQWDANKHLLKIIGSEFSDLLSIDDLNIRCDLVEKRLSGSIVLHKLIGSHYSVKDRASAHQSTWLSVLTDIRKMRKLDYQYLELLRTSKQ